MGATQTRRNSGSKTPPFMRANRFATQSITGP